MLCWFLLYNNANQPQVYTYPLLLSLHPTRHPTLQVITEHWAELPVLYSSFPLAIYCTHGSVQSFSRVRLFVTLWTAARLSRLPYPSQTAGVYPNPCPLSWWCHPTISSSVIPFSSCPQSFPASGSFQMSQLSTSGGQSIGVAASKSVLPMNTQDRSLLGWTDWISLQSKGLSRVFSNTTVQKHRFFSTQLSL